MSNGTTRWLAAADRILTAYSPEEAVLLRESKHGQRELAVWSSASARVVQDFVDFLRQYPLQPDDKTVAELLRTLVML